MNVLSLFDGMSCGRLALDRAGIHVSTYYASEIDTHAIKVSKDNWHDIVHLGDITKWRYWKLDWSSIGLVMGGSPCQGFSFAGKQLAFDDPRSKLFFVFVDILNHIKKRNPRVRFLLENVKMRQDYLGVITQHLGVEPVFINSSLLSAQNRQRYYWTNWPVTQPEDRGIVLADVLESPEEIDPDMYHGEKAIAYMERGSDKWQQAGDRRADRYTQTPDTKKSFTLTANFYKGVPYNYFQDYRPAAIVGRRLNERGIVLSSALDADVPAHRKEYHIDEKHWKGTSVERYIEKGFRQVALTERRTEEAKQIRKEFREKYGRDFSPRRGKELVARSDGKMNCLTATYSIKEHTVIDEHLCYRKLTPTECEALQTVPRNYTAHVSNTQRYKCLGNAWTVDVIAHIFSHIEARMVLVEKQLDLFEGAA